jgi:hypothetical protein
LPPPPRRGRHGSAGRPLTALLREIC